MKLATMKPKQVAKILKPAVAALLAAQAIEQVELDKKNARVAPIFASRKRAVAAEWLGSVKSGYVTDAKAVYLMSDEDAEEYFALYQAALDAEGYTMPKGQCPHLLANNNVIKARRALIDAAEPLTSLTFEQISCSVNCIENIEEYIKTLVGLVLVAK